MTNPIRLRSMELYLVVSLIILMVNLSGCCCNCLDAATTSLAKNDPVGTLDGIWIDGERSYMYDAPVFIYHDGRKARYYKASILSEDSAKVKLKLKRVNTRGKRRKGKPVQWTLKVVSLDSARIKRPGQKSSTLWKKADLAPPELQEAIWKAKRDGLLASSSLPAPSSTSETPEVSPPPHPQEAPTLPNGRGVFVKDMNVKEIVDTHDANKLRANSLYKGNRFRLLGGYVSQVYRSYDDELVVRLTPSEKGYGSAISVHMLESQVEQAMALKTGDAVTIIATGKEDLTFERGVFD